MPTGGIGGAVGGAHAAGHLARARTAELQRRLHGEEPHGSMLRAAQKQIASEATHSKTVGETLKLMGRVHSGQVTM